MPHHLSGDFQGKLFDEKISIKALSDIDSLRFVSEGLADTEMVNTITDFLLKYFEGSFNILQKWFLLLRERIVLVSASNGPRGHVS